MCSLLDSIFLVLVFINFLTQRYQRFIVTPLITYTERLTHGETQLNLFCSLIIGINLVVMLICDATGLPYWSRMKCNLTSISFACTWHWLLLVLCFHFFFKIILLILSFIVWLRISNNIVNRNIYTFNWQWTLQHFFAIICFNW